MLPSHKKDRAFVAKQARPPAGQTVTARTTCISSSSLEGLRQDISASLPHSHDQEEQPYHRYFSQVSMLSRSTALKPIAIKNAASQNSAYQRALSDRSSRTDASSASRRQSDNTSDCPEKLLFAKDVDVDQVQRSAKQSRFRRPPSTQISRSPDYRAELLAEDYVPEHMIASLDISAQEPPPDLSSSVVSTWTHIYEHQAAEDQAHDDFVNSIIDELDKSFTPTLEKHSNIEQSSSHVEGSEHASDATNPVREPEWLRSMWWKRGSMDGLRKDIPRGPYDSRHTHSEYGSSF